MKLSNELIRFFDSHPDDFWGDVEITFQRGQATLARSTKQVRFRDPKRDEINSQNDRMTRNDRAASSR
jgi:hypothetical protein